MTEMVRIVSARAPWKGTGRARVPARRNRLRTRALEGVIEEDVGCEKME